MSASASNVQAPEPPRRRGPTEAPSQTQAVTTQLAPSVPPTCDLFMVGAPCDRTAEEQVVGVAVATSTGSRLVRALVDVDDLYLPEMRRLLAAAFELDSIPIALRESEVRTYAAAVVADVAFVEVERLVRDRCYMTDPGKFAVRVRAAARRRRALVELEEAKLRLLDGAEPETLTFDFGRAS